MKTQPDAEPLPVVAVKFPGVTALLEDFNATANLQLQRNASVLDANFSDIAPGHDNADAWYEP